MFGKQKFLILPIAALALAMNGAAFAQSKSQTEEQALYGSKSAIVQDRYTNEAPAGVTKETAAQKLADKALDGSKSAIVQDQYTNEG